MQRITVLRGTFDDFMKALDVRIPSPFRGLVARTALGELPIARRFQDKTAIPSKNLAQFMSVDADDVKSINVAQTVMPADFYKGFNPGFSAIDQQLDVRRRLNDEILSDVFLADENEHLNRLELVLIKGHAGAGKSVMMRRLAWEAAHDYDCLCLFVRPGGLINSAALQELVELCRCRIYLFVDDAADRIRELEALAEHIGSAGSKMTVIAAARINEWNVSCQSLHSLVSEVYEIPYLTSEEIDQLLELLAKHKAEGKLSGRSLAERKSEIEERAGRQLLVALHEATLGLPFVDIIKNEFDGIWPLEAKQIYLTICVLNRLNVPVRAGVISRIHGVPFDDFKKRLFLPLEHIVQAEFDEVTRDYVYRARHPHIAEMVFETVLTKQEERFDSFMRCLGALNIDYSSDRIAFRQMTRGKTVLDLFPGHEFAAAVYKRAGERAGEKDGTLIHQMALYELNRPNGSLARSAELLATAAALRPFDTSIKHSLAEFHLRSAEEARTGLEQEKHLREGAALCRDCNRAAPEQPYGYTTLAKIGLKRLEGFGAWQE